MQIALKVDVDTLRGTREGVPALLRLFERFDVKATFLFSLGPDHTGRALRRIFRPGFLRKVSRTSVASHYGIKTLLYGTLLPGPHIGQRCADVMRSVHSAGHEVGVHCYDHIKWQDFVAGKDEIWTRNEMSRAVDAFRDVFGFAPRVIGAAGWQINPHALALEDEFGFHYASDTRGTQPFFPEMDGVRARCVQLPTTLPTLDELIGVDGITAANVHEVVLRHALQAATQGHVYTLHAELEGMQLRPVMEQLLTHWRSAGVNLTSLGAMFARLDLSTLPTCQIRLDTIPGRSGTLAVQRAERMAPSASAATA